MKALIYKDFCAIRKTAIFIFILLVLFPVYFAATGLALIIPLYFVIIPVQFIATLSGLDEIDQFELFALATHLRRKDLVFSRYLISWSIAVLSAVIMGIIALLSVSTIELKLFLIALALIVPTLFSSVFQPFILKFGINKSRIITGVTFALMFGFFTTLGKIVSGNPLAKIQHLSLPLLSLLMIGLGVLLNFVSYRISLMLMEKKEY